MFRILLARLQQGYRTMSFPRGAPPAMPDRFLGRPEIDPARCAGAEDCRACAEACPTGAIGRSGAARRGDGASAAPGLSLDLGRCLFCAECVSVCPAGAIVFTKDYRLATRERGRLLLEPGRSELALATALGKKLRRLLGRSLKLRQVSAGGCNACEADVNVLTTVGWDLGRFGIQFVASPRHADGLLVTGPVTKNMELALRKTYEAVPEPKIVIVSGACAISGGPYIGHDEAIGGAANLRLESGLLPVDLFIPGCPPHPLTILDGLLRLTGRIKEKAERS